MAVPLAPRGEMDFILVRIQRKLELEETRYLPPAMKDDILVSGLMVSEGTVVHPKTARVGKGENTTDSTETPE